MTRSGFGRAAVIILAALASTLAGAEPRRLIAVGDNYCPYNCAPEAPLRGYMVELLELALGKSYVVDYRIEPWTRAISLVESGKHEVLIGTAGGTERKLLLTEPMGLDRSCFFVRKDSTWRYENPHDLEKIRLGVIQDYVYDSEGPIDRIIANYRAKKDARLEVSYGKDALTSSLRKLNAGRTDAVIENENVGRYAIHELGMDKSLRMVGCAKHYVSALHLGVSPNLADAPALVETINTGIKRLRESGELRKILVRYGVKDWHTLPPNSGN